MSNRCSTIGDSNNLSIDSHRTSIGHPTGAPAECRTSQIADPACIEQFALDSILEAARPRREINSAESVPPTPPVLPPPPPSHAKSPSQLPRPGELAREGSKHCMLCHPLMLPHQSRMQCTKNKTTCWRPRERVGPERQTRPSEI